MERNHHELLLFEGEDMKYYSIVDTESQTPIDAAFLRTKYKLRLSFNKRIHYEEPKAVKRFLDLPVKVQAKSEIAILKKDSCIDMTEILQAQKAQQREKLSKDLEKLEQLYDQRRQALENKIREM